MVQNWPYPQWLKLSLAGLLLLLAFALLHGRKYFQAGKDLYRGEQLVEKGRFQEALPYLKATMKLAPNSDKGALLTAKAALLSTNARKVFRIAAIMHCNRAIFLPRRVVPDTFGRRRVAFRF